MSKKKVAVLFGGRSSEHEISIITAIDAIGAIDVLKYEVIPVYISQQGRWYTGKELLQRNFYKGLPGCLESIEEVVLYPTPSIGGLVKRFPKKGLFSKPKEEIIPVDVYLPLFHGQFGEDGCIQGLFEMADVTYCGSNVIASAVAMNKSICKDVLKSNGIPVLPSKVFEKREVLRDISKVRAAVLSEPTLVNFPLFVKPCNLGSSVGIAKVSNVEELDSAILKAVSLDTHVLIEPFLPNMFEINISVLDTENGPKASVVEVPSKTGEALSYEDKYLRGGGKKKTAQASQGMASLVRAIDPESLSDTYKKTVTELALKSYQVLGCSGVARFDFMVDTAKDKIYFNELNPLPGSISFYLWEKSKPPVFYTELVTEIIEQGIRNKEVKDSLKREFGFKALFG